MSRYLTAHALRSFGQVNRCHAGLISHDKRKGRSSRFARQESGVQLASPQPIPFGGVVQREDCWPATSRPEATKTAGLIRGQGDWFCLAPGQRVRLPPLPPISPGRPLWSRHRSEKPDKHVRLVLLAPTVTVAEWLRRLPVDLSTRVQFPPVTPMCAGVVQRIEHFGPNEEMPVRFRPPVPVFCGRSSV